MSLIQINNGDSGLDARGKINDAFTAVDTLASTSWTSTGTGDTTDETETTIWTWTIESPGTQVGYNVMTIRASVVGYCPNDGGKAYGAELFATFHCQAPGTMTQIGTTDIVEKTSFSTATSHLSIGDGSSIIFTVTGEASKYIKWNAEFRTMMTDYID